MKLKPASEPNPTLGLRCNYQGPVSRATIKPPSSSFLAAASDLPTQDDSKMTHSTVHPAISHPLSSDLLLPFLTISSRSWTTSRSPGHNHVSTVPSYIIISYRLLHLLTPLYMSVYHSQVRPYPPAFLPSLAFLSDSRRFPHYSLPSTLDRDKTLVGIAHVHKFNP
jgi:hypothetical protein